MATDKEVAAAMNMFANILRSDPNINPRIADAVGGLMKNQCECGSHNLPKGSNRCVECIHEDRERHREVVIDAKMDRDDGDMTGKDFDDTRGRS